MSALTQKESGQKALEAAIDFLKVTTGLATGTLVFSAGWISSASQLTKDARFYLEIAWIFLLLSIFIGVFIAQGRLITKIANQNYKIHNDHWLNVPVIIHQLLLFFGVLFMGITLKTTLSDQPPFKDAKIKSANDAIIESSSFIRHLHRLENISSVTLIKGIDQNNSAMAVWMIQFEAQQTNNSVHKLRNSDINIDKKPTDISVFIASDSGDAVICSPVDCSRH